MRDLEQLFRDLLAIEVNTIVKDNITGQKMPSLPFALLDIVEEYASALESAGVDLGRYFGLPLGPLPDRADSLSARADSDYARYKEAGDEDPEYEYWRSAETTYSQTHARAFDGEGHGLLNYVPYLWPLLTRAGELAPGLGPKTYSFSMDAVTNGWDSFERVRVAAKDLVYESERASSTIAPDELRVLARIIGSCNQIKYIVQGIQQRHAALSPDEPPTRGRTASWAELVPRTRQQLLQSALHTKRVPELPRDEDYRVIRKAWEVGTERILIQTSVQIDGDVVTRISTELTELHSEAIRDLMLGTHHRAVRVGIEHWKSLVETTTELVSRFTKFVRDVAKP